MEFKHGAKQIAASRCETRPTTTTLGDLQARKLVRAVAKQSLREGVSFSSSSYSSSCQLVLVCVCATRPGSPCVRTDWRSKLPSIPRIADQTKISCGRPQFFFSWGKSWKPYEERERETETGGTDRAPNPPTLMLDSSSALLLCLHGFHPSKAMVKVATTWSGTTESATGSAPIKQDSASIPKHDEPASCERVYRERERESDFSYATSKKRAGTFAPSTSRIGPRFLHHVRSLLHTSYTLS